MGKILVFLEGLVLGAITGALVGLLFAPQPGNELIGRLRQRAELIVAEGRRASAERRAELEAQFAKGKQVRKGS